MTIIEQYCEWIQPPPSDTLQVIERAGRTCYKSEDKITADSAAKFVKRILDSGHESVIEHVIASMLLVTDRGVSHEVVRHRIASFSQESTRYVDYGKPGDLTFVKPVWIEETSPTGVIWHAAMQSAEDDYLQLRDMGWPPQYARSVLPNSLKTEIVMTANMREWRWFFTKRCDKAAHPQMRALAIRALKMFTDAVPVLFDDLVEKYCRV